MTDRVLVTGVSGFIGSHVTERLLAKGYDVRGTVRNKAKGSKIVDALAANGCDVSRLELVEANLASDDGWADAVNDCRYIQHIASPLPHDAPKEREALVPEARAGAQRVLEHGFSAGAERIVLTSSIAAMIGQPGKGAKMTITEDGVVFGPDTYGNAGASLGILKAMMIGKFPRVPKMGVPLIDVRDCASIHVAAMTAKDAGGRRLLATGQTIWFHEIAAILRAQYPQLKGLPKGEIPNFIVRVMALFDDRMQALLSDIGTFHEADAAYVSTLTHVIPRPAKEAILAGAESLIANGSVRLS